ncbi:MAG TPA: glycosyltransferase family 39 protein [Anaerolineales bacterium]|nr:glycosyltransferase family 39 protein [Anaerolineales bacterium]
MHRHLQRWRVWHLALAVIVLGFGLRAYRLDNKNLWYDEGFSVFMARQPLTELPEETALDVHPPAYFAVLHGWRAVAGESAYALRFPSALAGVLTLAAAYRLGRRYLRGGAGLAAAALLAIHRPSLWYSQEIRMYAPAMLLAVLALWAMLAYLTRGGWRAWLAYIAVIAAGLHTLYLFVLAPLTLGAAGLLALALAPDRGRRVWGWIGAHAVAALSLLPWLLFALPRRPERFSEAQPIGLLEVTGLWLNPFLLGASPDPTAAWADWPVYLLALGCLALAGGLALQRRERPDASAVAVALAAGIGAALTIGLIWVLNQPWDFQLTFSPTPRYLVGLVPWSLIALGAATREARAGRDRRALARAGPRAGRRCAAQPRGLEPDLLHRSLRQRHVSLGCADRAGVPSARRRAAAPQQP